MATLKLTLDTRRVKKDKTFPLVFRITVAGQSRDIPLGYSIKREEWNFKMGTIKKNLKELGLATRVKELKVEYLNRIIEFERKFPNSTNVQELKDFITTTPKGCITVFDFWQEEIDYLQKAGRNGGARVYIEKLSAINNIRSLHIPFEKIDYRFLKELEAEMVERGLKVNSIAVYFRTLRAVYNKAIHAKVISYDQYPFRSFKIRKEPTLPRILTVEELQRYFRTDIDKNSWLYDSWLMGKLMFMLIGINFKDMVLMKEDQIQHGRLIYSRAKTQKKYSIKLLPQAIEIINYFKGKGAQTILGKLTPEQLTNKAKLPVFIRQANRVFNKHIGRIGNMINTNESITGYTFRYSSANIAKQLGFSKDLIAEALGHSYGSRVTGIYLEAYDLDHIDMMNEKVCSLVLNGKAH